MSIQYDLYVPGAHALPSVKKCKVCGEMFKYYHIVFINYGGRGFNLEDHCDICINKKVLEGQEKEKQLRDKIRKLHIDNRAIVKEMVDEQYTKTQQKNNEFNEF